MLRLMSHRRAPRLPRKLRPALGRTCLHLASSVGLGASLANWCGEGGRASAILGSVGRILLPNLRI